MWCRSEWRCPRILVSKVYRIPEGQHFGCTRLTSFQPAIVEAVDKHTLSHGEQEIWAAFKTLAEATIGSVAADIERATGLSSADFEVLCRIHTGPLNQQVLATLMGWHKSRLSHQLTRMQQRGLVARSSGPGRGIFISLLPGGKEALLVALPVHAASVRRHLLDRVTPQQAAVIVDLFSGVSK